MIAWFKRCWRLLNCQHEYIFVMTVDEQNLRARFNHKSKLYKCVHCNKVETREEWASHDHLRERR